WIFAYNLFNIGTELFVAGVGIWGILLTLYGNTLVSLHQQEKQWNSNIELHAEERRHRRKTVRLGLIEELVDLRRVRIEHIKAIESRDDSVPFFVTTEVNDTVFKSLVSNIGLLTEIEVKEVVTTYRKLYRQSSKFRLFGTPCDESGLYVLIPPDKMNTVLEIEKGMKSLLDKAIELLGGHLKD
ncbi:MAG: hypothetical protein OXI63_07960, partial [Candidatus Poribacteria bacterium]|nr:hypothetical protein [Candidatus Poribacteria bacterium]